MSRYQPSRHDHVSHMQFSDTEARCTECSQEWEMTDRGWRAVPAWVTDKHRSNR